MLALGLSSAVASHWIGRAAFTEWARTAMEVLSSGIVALSIVQYFRWRRMQSRHDELVAVLDAVPHVLFFKSKAFRFKALNAEFGRVFQIDVNAALGKSDGELFGPELAATFAAQDAELIAMREARTFDDKIAVSGSVRSFQSRKQPVYDRHGRLRGIVGVSIDVTDEKILRQRLEDANVAKDRFIATIGHEVRTPLDGIVGMLELLLGTTLSDDQWRMVSLGHESSTMLLSSINDLLDFSKFKAGKLSLENRPLSLQRLVRDVCETMRPLAVRKSVGLQSQSDPRLPSLVIGDPTRLQQILTNLIGNAIKFTERGRVHVVTREHPVGWLQLTIEDTGIGIPAEALESIFLPFEQGDVSTSRRYGGAGLGLSIVRQLVEAMGGTVSCESKLGQGSRFTASLPLQPFRSKEDGLGPALEALPPRQGMLPAEDDELDPSQRYRVLVVEDQPINREVAKRQLQALGHRCVVCENGEQALLAVENTHFDVVLTDCHMPIIDGFELTRRLRSSDQERLRGIPIVGVTATTIREEHLRCFAVGMNAIVLKPWTLGGVRAALKQACDRREPLAEEGRSFNASDIDREALGSAFAGMLEAGEVLLMCQQTLAQDRAALVRHLDCSSLDGVGPWWHRASGALSLLGQRRVEQMMNAFLQTLTRGDEAAVRLAGREVLIMFTVLQDWIDEVLESNEAADGARRPQAGKAARIECGALER
ncbi:MAG: response regulator [Variovorax sp.]|nr:response regulator [Variovorax sp.]